VHWQQLPEGHATLHIATTRRMSNAKCAEARQTSRIQSRIGAI